MKRLFKTWVVPAMIMMLIMGGTAGADDFFDFIGYRVKGDGVVKSFDPVINGARISGQWDDVNLDRHWDPNEVMRGTIRVYSRDGDLVLETPTELNRDQLQTWSENHADEILSAIFPGGFSQTTGVSEDGIMDQQLFDNKIMKKVTPQKKTEDYNFITDDFKGALEYLWIDKDGYDGQAGSIVMGYAHDLDNRLELGVQIPYRYADIDDDINSESHFIGLDFYGKYPVSQWDTLTMNIGADISGSVYYLTSDAVEHAGNFKYGAGMFTSLEKEFAFGTLSGGISYNVSKAHIKSDLIDTDNRFIEEAIDYVNDLDPVQSLTYGFNFGIMLSQSASVNIETVRTNFFSSDIPDDRDAQTVAGISFTYFPTEAFALNFGIRRTFELEDIDVTGITFGTLYEF